MSDLNGTPLSAGNLTQEDIRGLISSGVKQALAEVRQERKLNRNDVGTGNPELGEILKQYREGQELTQRKLADFAGLHPTTVGKIESGERGMSLDTFARLAYQLDEEFAWRIIYTIVDDSYQRS